MRPIPIAFAIAVIIGLVSCGDRTTDRAVTTAVQAEASAEAARSKAREEAMAARETERLAALWEYADVAVPKGRQLSAVIRSTNDVETSGQGAQSVRLVFREHPAWGKSSYLVLSAGDFNCYGGCTVKVIVDEAAPKSMAARRPPTDEAIAMFINDFRTLWRFTEGAKRINIEFPVKAGGARTATFDVAGLDRSKLPAWDAASATNAAR